MRICGRVVGFWEPKEVLTERRRSVILAEPALDVEELLSEIPVHQKEESETYVVNKVPKTANRPHANGVSKPPTVGMHHQLSKIDEDTELEARDDNERPQTGTDTQATEPKPSGKDASSTNTIKINRTEEVKTESEDEISKKETFPKLTDIPPPVQLEEQSQQNPRNEEPIESDHKLKNEQSSASNVIENDYEIKQIETSQKSQVDDMKPTNTNTKNYANRHDDSNVTEPSTKTKNDANEHAGNLIDTKSFTYARNDVNEDKGNSIDTKPPTKSKDDVIVDAGNSNDRTNMKARANEETESNVVKGTTTSKKIDANEDTDNSEVSKLSTNTNDTDELGEEIITRRHRRSGIVPLSVQFDAQSTLPTNKKSSDDEVLIKTAIQQNDFLSKIISGKRLEDVVNAMYSREISAKESIIKQGDKGSHMYISAKGRYQVLVKKKEVSEFDDIRVFGELAILYNARRLATIKALTPGKVWVLDRNVYQQITVGDNIRQQDEIMEFLMNNEKLKVAGKAALQEVANLLKSDFFKPGTQIVRQGDKGHKFFIIRAGTVTITKDGEGIVGHCKKGDCFGELALLKEDCRQATVTADAPGVECLTLERKEFIEHFGELESWTDIKVRPPNSLGGGETEHQDIDLRDLKIIKTLGVGGFGRVELVQHTKIKDLVFALKYLKKIDIVMQHQQEHVYNEKNIQMACKSPFIIRLYRTYKDNKYIYLLMESCLGGDLWSLLQKQKLRRFEEKEAKFIAGCVLEAFEYLHSRGIIYRDLKPENLLIATNGYIKLTDFGFAKKISSRGKTFTFAGTPEYVAPEIVLHRGHDRSVDYWAFGAFIFELLTGRTPFRTDDSSHMKTYNKILSGIDNVRFPSYVNLKAKRIIEKLCRPIPSERLGMQRGGIKDIKGDDWFKGFDWQKFVKCEVPSPFKPKLKSQIDTQYFDQFKKDTDVPPDELSGWDMKF
ncbi:hypothetical protein NQ315_004840 [Exocentrus adspersus]|uniref:cGMP-dependent protein kinase n=1 Tax=Exocentrus adspersus TaxID=1586481 RepID=A0AAV8W240_9CUCU|nr:hypothetical protein NQ315_004840 [Exocentrus adspersus]